MAAVSQLTPRHPNYLRGRKCEGCELSIIQTVYLDKIYVASELVGTPSPGLNSNMGDRRHFSSFVNTPNQKDAKHG